MARQIFVHLDDASARRRHSRVFDALFFIHLQVSTMFTSTACNLAPFLFYFPFFFITSRYCLGLQLLHASSLHLCFIFHIENFFSWSVFCLKVFVSFVSQFSNILHELSSSFSDLTAKVGLLQSDQGTTRTIEYT